MCNEIVMTIGAAKVSSAMCMPVSLSRKDGMGS